MYQNGTVKEAYVSAMWLDTKPGVAYTQKHTVVDRYDASLIENIKADKNLTCSVYPVIYPHQGKLTTCFLHGLLLSSLTGTGSRILSPNGS